MTDYHELIPLPPASDMNTGLTAARPYTMLSLLGKPGRLTQDCSAITNARLYRQMTTHHFNNFAVTGWRPAVDALAAALAEVYHEKPDLHAVIRTAGMLCCRRVRGGNNFSDHSWGCAVDLQIEGQLDPMGAHVVQKGILALYPYLHKQGFYWGAEFNGRPDAMHFGLADETVRRLYRQYYG